jgi:hypothetical protein
LFVVVEQMMRELLEQSNVSTLTNGHGKSFHQCVTLGKGLLQECWMAGSMFAEDRTEAVAS